MLSQDQLYYRVTESLMVVKVMITLSAIIEEKLGHQNIGVRTIDLKKKWGQDF